MRIACTYCGERGSEEFVYRGDASVMRPDGDASIPLDEMTLHAWADYVYLRENPSGSLRELWYHAGGCRAWLVVTRDVTTHEIQRVESARDVAMARLSASTMSPS